jgi:hypothetical protein
MPDPFDSAPRQRHDDERGAAHFYDHHLCLWRKTTGLVGDGKPAFTRKARVAGMMLVADGIDRQRVLSDEAVRRAWEKEPWPDVPI